jgi:hypothetical protein
MKIIGKLFGLSLFVVGCATASNTHPLAAGAGRARAIEIEGPAPRSVVSGPTTIHAYSTNDGMDLFTVAAATGTDRDCQLARARASAGENRLQADRVVTVNVPAGRVACVETTASGTHELLWHQMESQSEPSLLARSN